MSAFGQGLFGGSRFIFWCLGPLCLLCGVGCLIGAPFAFASKDLKAAIALTLLGTLGVCFFLALLNIKKFLWAARVATGIVTLFYALYFVDTYFVEKQELTPSTRRSAATPWNAIMGFLVIGAPCLWFTIRGRFGNDAKPDHPPWPSPWKDDPSL